MAMFRKSGFVLRNFTSSAVKNGNKSYKLVVVGGGAGGCASAAKFSKKLGKGEVAVIEPSDMHYYQPLWTLVGGGLQPLAKSGKPMKDVLRRNADWLMTKATGFDPDKNIVRTESGDDISYEFLVVAMGLKLEYDKIKGLPEAFDYPGVCSNYSIKYVEKTLKAIKDFKQGNALFTFPKVPIKCPGAPQKIAYIAERILRQDGKNFNIHYYTTLPVLFPVKKYADALWKVVEQRGINVHLEQNLVQVDPDKKEAVFENLSNPGEMECVPYEMIHITPPMCTPDALKNNAPKLVDTEGFVDVDPMTLQHKRYPNVFSLGDCSSIATARTAAAAAAQLGILRKNLGEVMEGKKELSAAYDGYTSCPLVTGPGECILAEFDNSVPPKPLETFPFNQAVPRRPFYVMKAHFLSQIYWQMMKGRWEGPKPLRKLLHLGMKR